MERVYKKKKLIEKPVTLILNDMYGKTREIEFDKCYYYKPKDNYTVDFEGQTYSSMGNKFYCATAGYSFILDKSFKEKAVEIMHKKNIESLETSMGLHLDMVESFRKRLEQYKPIQKTEAPLIQVKFK